VAATNRDLAGRVKAGGFREDLFYRLDVFPVRLPPLRARKEDVPDLAREFARSCGESARGRAFELSPAAVEKLVGWEWPGNIRELKNVVERAVLLSTGPLIRPADVVLGAPGEEAVRTPSLDGSLDETVERWKKAGEGARIRRALEEAAGDRTAAAGALGIPLKRLVQRIRDLRI
jgi:transcriptional regulator with GAF, ATPase, and Fis domain